MFLIGKKKFYQQSAQQKGARSSTQVHKENHNPEKGRKEELGKPKPSTKSSKEALLASPKPLAKTTKL